MKTALKITVLLSVFYINMAVGVAQTVCAVDSHIRAPIQAAIDVCAKRGGGMVWVPPGKITSGPFLLKDNVELHLAAGAVVQMNRKDADWPDGLEALVTVKGARNVSITGTGTFDGQATWAYEPVKRVDIDIAWEQANAKRAGVELKRYYRTGEAQKMLFDLTGAQNLRIEGVTILNAPGWNVRLQNCKGVTIKGITLLSDLEKGVNSDGIDIVSSSNVIISDSTIITGDDAICLKTSAPDWSAAHAEPTENVLVNNCILGSSSTPMMIGTETHADIRHVVFSNIVVRDSNKVFGINVQDGATVSDIRFSNVTFDTRRRHWNWWGSAEVMKFVLLQRTPTSRLGHIEHITIDGVQGIARGTSVVAGHKDRKIENVSINNLSVRMYPEEKPDKRATDGMIFRDISGLSLRNIRLGWDQSSPEPAWASAIRLENVDGFQSSELAVTAAKKGTPAIVKLRVPSGR